jgi:iron complex transport system permease protein
VPERAHGPGRPLVAVAALVLGTAALGFASILLLLGGGLLPAAVEIPFRATFQIVLHELSGGALFPDPCVGTGITAALCPSRTFIVWQIYVPEVVLAVLAGIGLGISGATLQGIFRNPLADPYLLGIATGGTLGAAVVEVYNVWPDAANLVLPLAAFLGAGATGFAVLVIARGRSTSVETLLLAGVAISYLLSGVLSLVLLYNPYRTIQVTYWLLGGLGSASWAVDGVVFALILSFGSVLTLFGRELNLLQLGPDVAQSAGVDARRVRTQLLLLASLVTAGVVAFTGVIGFVGLVSPHIVRRWVGTDYRLVVPASGAVGALFMLAANDAASLVFPHSVFPIGIFTAFAGVPFFLVLLYRHRRTSFVGDG